MSTGAFKDHFSAHAGAYATYRPTYPARLYRWLAEQAPGRELAWDCATGNGQAAIGLARQFERVIATDASAQQIRHARPHPAVEYRVEAAEASTLDTASADLITLSQALHWLEREAFYAEADRVLRPGGVLAAWTYALVRVAPPIDTAVDAFNDTVVGAFWPEERQWVDRGYRGIGFPYPDVPAPRIELQADWTLDEFCGYLQTWTAVRRYRSDHGRDPVAALRDGLDGLWGGAGERRTARWPLRLRVGRKPAGAHR